MAKFISGQRVSVRYTDGAWYPARIIQRVARKPDHDTEDGDSYLVRWDPPDPNIGETFPAPEDDIK